MIEKLFNDERIARITIEREDRINENCTGFLLGVETFTSDFGTTHEGLKMTFHYSKGKTIEEALEKMEKKLGKSLNQSSVL